MIRLFKTLSFFIVLILIAIIAIPYVVPAEKYEGLITQKINEATGLEIEVNGGIGFSLIPNIHLTVKDVRIPNPNAMKAEEFLSLSSLSVGVKLLPLLKNKIEVSDFTLMDPIIQLEKDARGNLVLPIKERPAAARTPGDPATTEQNKNLAIGAAGFALAHVRIINGSLTMYDNAKGSKTVLDPVNVRIDASDFERPARLAGDFTWNGEKVDIKFELDKLKALLEGRETALRFQAASDPLTIKYKGVAQRGAANRIGGKLQIEAHDFQIISRWIDGGFDNLEGSGVFNTSFTTQGTNAAEMLRRLSGDGSISVSKSKLNGFSLVKLIMSAVNPAAAVALSDDTEIASMIANFALKDGVIFNEDLTLDTLLMKFTGKGEINLPEDRMKYRIIGQQDLTIKDIGVKLSGIPVTFEGRVTKPSFKVDVTKFLQQNIKDNLLTGFGVTESEAGGKLKEELREPIEKLQKKLPEGLKKIITPELPGQILQNILIGPPPPPAPAPVN